MKGARLSLGILLGIVITLAGYFVGRSVCIFPGGRHHLIHIGPKATDLPSDEEKAYVSLSAKHRITWQSTDGRPLIIEFDNDVLKSETKGLDPFLKMTDSPDKKFRRVECGFVDECRSNEINPALADQVGFLKCISLKYYQQIGTDRADGWIIIRP